MGDLTDELRDFLDEHRVGVLATIASDGRPRQSVVYYVRDGDRLLVSTLSERLKAKDVRRSGWASLWFGETNSHIRRRPSRAPRRS